MRIAVALGGNALLRRGQPADASAQLANLARAVPALAAIADEHDVLITHGNGPQIGLLALESAADPALSAPYPLDTLGAETQGMIGYWLVRSLGGALPDRQVVALLTQTVVSADDPAFAAPTKFVGPVYPQSQADRLGVDRGWLMRPDGSAWRRVVPSPEPCDIVELAVIRRLLADHVVVVAAGGGGVPVVREPSGILRGVEGVVDKDLTAARLAIVLRADVLLLLTDVAAVFTDFGTPQARPITEASPQMLAGLHFPTGSIGPKVEAARRFVLASGGRAAIGELDGADGLLSGVVGTQITTEAFVHPCSCTETPTGRGARPRQ